MAYLRAKIQVFPFETGKNIKSSAGKRNSFDAAICRDQIQVS
jgi:hypothetical protein